MDLTERPYEEDSSKTYIEFVNDKWYQSKSSLEVSIIIPSHNKYPLNLLSLYSLEAQTLEFSRFEVIIIDDASTDKSYSELTNYQAPFPYRYIHCTQNLGRAKARNLGIEISKGKIIIFLDAEMIVDPYFVHNHLKEHGNSNNTVVTGAFYLQNVFTTIFKNFTDHQHACCEDLMCNDSELAKHYQSYLKIKNSGKLDDQPWTFFTREDILSQQYKKMTMDVDYFSKTILNHYGEDLQGFSFPWMALMSGNVSASRDLLIKVGKFDEEFVLYGYEDWELGYRLHLAGAKFKARKSLTSYHQEHPISANKWNEAVINFNIFTKKHPHVNVFVLGLEIAGFLDLNGINKLYKEYKYLKAYYPNKFYHVKNAFRSILTTTAILLKYDIRHRNLLEASGIDDEQKQKIYKEISILESYGKCRKLTHLFRKLI